MGERYRLRLSVSARPASPAPMPRQGWPASPIVTRPRHSCALDCRAPVR